MKISAIYLQERELDVEATRKHFQEILEKSGVTARMCAAHMGISEQYLCCLQKGRKDWNKELVKKFIAAMNNRNVLRAVG